MLDPYAISNAATILLLFLYKFPLFSLFFSVYISLSLGVAVDCNTRPTVLDPWEELPASVVKLSNSKMRRWWDYFAWGSRLASEMEIIVQSDAVHNYVLLADGDNIVEDVLVTILGRDRARRAPEPRLFFNDLELQKQKTLAEYGIELDSVLHLKCTPRVLARTDDLASPTKKAEKDCADSGSTVRPNGDGEMKIYVQSEYHGNYALEVDSSNTIQDVLTTVLPSSRLELYLEPELYFNGHRLETEKSLADYGIQDGSILHLEVTEEYRQQSVQRERPNVIPERNGIRITGRPLAIWEKEHDRVLLSLLVEQISNGGGENILHGGEDSWCNIAAKFKESTGLQYEHKHLSERFNFYRREYHIVNRIRHHQKFSWDHQRHIVIATDAEWNEYIKQNPEARLYRRRAIPYVDLLETLFANTEV